MISNFLKQVTEIVLRKRKELGITQEMIARHLNMSTGFISNVESYKKHYNLNHINQLAILFQCSPKDLIPDQPVKD